MSINNPVNLDSFEVKVFDLNNKSAIKEKKLLAVQDYNDYTFRLETLIKNNKNTDELTQQRNVYNSNLINEKVNSDISVKTFYKPIVNPNDDKEINDMIKYAMDDYNEYTYIIKLKLKPSLYYKCIYKIAQFL